MHIFNDKVVTLIIGSPGSGKSTMAAMLVGLANKKGVPAYCNYPVFGAYQVDMADLITRDLGESVLIVDEAGLSFNSRNTKAFTNEHYHWFATTRHRKTQVFIIVQNWGRVDIVLRNLATELVFCHRGFFSFTTYRLYRAECALITDHEGNATEFKDCFSKIKWRFFWRPKYYHMFDSYHRDREYRCDDPVLYPPGIFPPKQPFWRLLLGLKPKAAPPPAAGPEAGDADEDDVDGLYPDDKVVYKSAV